MKTELNEQEKRSAFLRAVSGFKGSKDRWAKHIETGLDDDALAKALKYELGHFGGSGGRDSLNIAYQGDGLKIWAGAYSLNPCIDAPILEGIQTIKMARLVFGIIDPTTQQMDLFGGAL